MGNPLTDVVFEAAGKQYRLVLGTWARATLEKRTGVPWTRFFARPLKDWSADHFLELLIAGLSRHHEEATPREVADLMDALGSTKILEILSEAMRIAFPAPKAGEGGGSRPTKRGRPRKPA